MDNESKFIIAAYQKKAFDLFNQVIVIEAKFQQQQELIEAQNAKIQEFADANNNWCSRSRLLKFMFVREKIKLKTSHQQKQKEQQNVTLLRQRKTFRMAVSSK